MATERSLTLMKTSGSLDSESAQGAATPIVPVKSPQTRMSPPTFKRTPRTSLLTRAASQARPTMYPLAIPFKLMGQSDTRSAVRAAASSFQAGGSIQARALASSALVGTRSSRAHEDQSRVSASARGSNAPAVLRIHRSECSSTSKSSRETLDDGARRSCQRDKLAGWVVAVEDGGQSIDLTKHALFGGLGSRAALCIYPQLERRAQHVFVKEREFGFRSGHGPSRSARDQADQQTRKQWCRAQHGGVPGSWRPARLWQALKVRTNLRWHSSPGQAGRG